MKKKLLILGAILGLLGVVFGAFGAHGLKKIADADAVASFNTGVRYQMYHAFLVLLIGSSFKLTQKAERILFYLLLIGVLLFSGSIYLLSVQDAIGVDFSSIALITPLGGMVLIFAWAYLLFNFLKENKT